VVLLAPIAFAALGVYGRATGNLHQAWAMFSDSTTLRLKFEWVMEDGGLKKHHPARDGGPIAVLTSDRPRTHLHEYPLIESWIRAYLRYAHRQLRPEQAQAIRAVIELRDVRGQWRRRVIVHPSGGGVEAPERS